ncbi:MAG TPA: hypothetical protein VNN80_20455, partial [Polyangiaceae bacterium]|nr:hypothetical protein [Polyangiaceae bacterium]
MRTKNIQAIGMLMGSCLLAGAADAATPGIPGEPPAGTPAALPSGPVPAPEPAPTAPATDRGTSSSRVRRGAASKVLNIDIEGASAYVWRGINMFGVNQNTQAFSVFPSLTVTSGALSLGYWGAFQLSGDNKSELVDSGVGAQNNFVLKYNGWLDDDLAYSAMLTYWLYPFADADVAGTDTPMYLEPGAGISYLAGADLGLYVGYYRGLQSVTEPASFLYINPSIGKTFPLDDDLGLALGLAGGYKVFTNDPPTEDRALDLAFNVSLAIPLEDAYLTPQLHLAYATRDEAVVPDAEFSDSFIAWVGVHVGTDIGL